MLSIVRESFGGYLEGWSSIKLLNWALVITLGYVVAAAIYNRYFHPLAGFPGPFWASVSNIYFLKLGLSGYEQIYCAKLHKKYGSIIRVAPNMLITSDPALLPIIYNRKANKSIFFDTYINGQEKSVLSIRAYHEHHARRRKISHFYTMSAVKPMEGIIDKELSLWLKQLRELHVQTEKPVDFGPWSQWLSYDIVSEMAFGKEIGFIEQAKDVNNLVKNLRSSFPIMILLSRIPGLAKFLREIGLHYLVMPKAQDKKGFGYVMGFRDKLLEERISNPVQSERVDFLQYFIESTRPKSPSEAPLFTIEQVKAEIMLILLAGADTTASIFRSFILNIFYFDRRGRYYNRLMEEINNALRHGVLSRPIVKYEETTKHLPFLTACIRETMRCNPAIVGPSPRDAPVGGFRYVDPATGREWFIPEGSCLGLITYVIHRYKPIYGDDAEEFNPERWIPRPDHYEADISRIKAMEKADFTWGYGGRTCLGKHIAIMQLWKNITELLINFDIEFVNGKLDRNGHISIPVCKVSDLGLLLHDDMWITLRERSPVIS